jgi:transcriptional regulator with XRE-family HTH domain
VQFDLSRAIDTYNRTKRGPEEALMTQRRLAGLVGITEALVSRHATGRVSPGTESLLRYAQGLRCGIQDLFSDDHTMPSMA